MKTLLALLLTAITAIASDVIVFDPASPVVANRVVGYLRSQDTTAWIGNPNALINPTVPGTGTPRDWKVEGGNVVALTAQNIADIAAAEAAALITATKDGAKTTYDDNFVTGRVLRALVEILIDEINTIRGVVVGVQTGTFDPPNLANASGATSGNIPVAGAAFGDHVDVAAPYDLQGITATGYVASAGNVVVRLHNGTGGAINLASGTWKATVRRPVAMPQITPAQARTALRNKVDAQP